MYQLQPLSVTVGGVTRTISCQGEVGPQATGIANWNANSFAGCTVTAPPLFVGPLVANSLNGATLTSTTVNGVPVSTTITTNTANAINVVNNGTAPFSPNLLWLPNRAGVDVPVTCEGYADATIGAPASRRFFNCRGVTAAVAAGTYNATKALADTDTSTIGGYIKIERRNIVPAGSPATWTDVTMEILNLGIGAGNSGGAACGVPNPNAVLRIQRLRDNGGGSCTYFQSLNPWDRRPQGLYDPREGTVRDATTTDPMGYAGVMLYIALDVNNLRRWLDGTIGTTGTQTAQAASGNGFIVYFSDRRGNHNAAGDETGECGFEDHVNSTVTNGLPDGALQPGEDVNWDARTPTVITQETYGGTPSTIGAPAGMATAGVAPFATIPNSNNAGAVTPTAGAMRVNRVMLFRRALKLVNAGLVSLPATGLTVAAENPVYVHGNYNAIVPGTVPTNSAQWTTAWNSQASAPASVVGDAITLLSNNWSDAVVRSSEQQRIAAGNHHHVAVRRPGGQGAVVPALRCRVREPRRPVRHRRWSGQLPADARELGRPADRLPWIADLAPRQQAGDRHLQVRFRRRLQQRIQRRRARVLVRHQLPDAVAAAARDTHVP